MKFNKLYEALVSKMKSTSSATGVTKNTVTQTVAPTNKKADYDFVSSNKPVLNDGDKEQLNQALSSYKGNPDDIKSVQRHLMSKGLRYEVKSKVQSPNGNTQNNQTNTQKPNTNQEDSQNEEQ